MKKLMTALLTAMLLIASTAYADKFDVGVVAYAKDDYKKAITLFKPLALQGDVEAQYNLGVMYDEGSGVPQNLTMPASVSIERSSLWQSSVLELMRGIREGSISVSEMSAELIANQFDVFDKPWNRYRVALPDNLVSVVEAKNIWWSDDNRFFIRLYNPGGGNLLGFNFSISNFESDAEMLINFDLKSNPLPPYSYGVYSADWPFDYLKIFGSGTSNGIVTLVLSEK